MDSKRDLRKLWRLIATASSPRRAQLALTILLTLAGAFAELVTIGAVLPVLAIAASPRPIATIPLLGSILTPLTALTNGSQILAAALLLVVSAVVATVIRLLLTWTSSQFAFGLMQDLVMTVFKRSLHQPYSWYVQQNSSAIVSSLDKISLVIFSVISPGIQAATSAITAVCLVGFLFMLNPFVALVAAISLGLVYGVLSLVSSRTLRRVSEELAFLRTARIQAVQESLGGIRDILLDQSQAVVQEKLNRIEDRVRQDLTISGFIQLAPRPVIEGAAVILVALFAVWFSIQPGGLLAAVPTLGAIAIGAQRLMPMAQSVYLGWAGYSTHADSIGDLVALLDMPQESDAPEGASEPVTFEQQIEMREVFFRYADGTAALSGVNIQVAKGQCVGIIGRTGSGKSTLVDVLMGLLVPSEGELLVDGIPVSGTRVSGWRARIAHVPQSIFLRDASVAENVAFGSNNVGVDDERLRDAAARAGLLEFIDSLPEGFSTVVGERGIRLSGGQRQRIGIARALYKQADLLILDEATSALDSETEAAVMDSVASLGANLTIVLIAHRLTTVAMCDRVYRLENGRIVAEGSLDEVVLGDKVRTLPGSKTGSRG